MELIEIKKSEPYESDQVSIYQEMSASGKLVARPIYDKQSLLISFKSPSNVRCIEIKSSCIAGLGYKFKDEDNAKSSGVLDFINNLYSKDNSPKSFSLLCKEFVRDYLGFGESRLEIVRIGKKPVNLLVLSGKNTLTSIDRASIYQWDRYRNKIVEFKRYGQYSKNIHDTLALINTSPEDDYYGVPCYVSALGLIREYLKILDANGESLDNQVNPSMFITITGHVLDNDERVKVRDIMTNLKNKRSSVGILDFPTQDVNVNVINYGMKQVEGDYIQERESIKNEIIGLHGLTPELYGIISNGGISSGEKATGALKIFVQTTINPEKETLERLLNDFFRNEFPLFKDNEINFNSIDLTDSNEDSNTSLMDAQTTQLYISMGSLTLFNEYRISKGLPEFTEEEWKQLMINQTGVDYTINKGEF
jgi:hypothetical protein